MWCHEVLSSYNINDAIRSCWMINSIVHLIKIKVTFEVLTMDLKLRYDDSIYISSYFLSSTIIRR